MRKLIFVFIATFFVSSFYSQCKVEEDAFTKEKVAKFHWEDTWGPFDVIYEVKKTETNFTLGWSIQGSKVETSVPKGSEVMLKLENGEIIKLLTNMEAIPQPLVYNKTIWTKYLYSFVLTDADLAKLKDNKVEMVRGPDPSKNSTMDYKVFNKAIKKGAECISRK